MRQFQGTTRTVGIRIPLVLSLVAVSSLALLSAGCAGVSASKPSSSTAPTVSIMTPANGATVSGTVAVTATATDSVAVTGVQFQLDGANVGSVATTTPYSYSWDTTKATNGSHTLRATAQDAAGNTGTSTNVTVTVNNSKDSTPPTVSITSPANGATVSGTITVSATASDNVGVASVQFEVDGTAFGSLDTTVPYSQSLNTTTLTNGTHTLLAVATDTSNNKATSAGVSITVNNPSSTNQPNVSITLPLAGTTVSKTITVTATASDSKGIASVQFQVDGSNLGTAETSSPYSESWNTTTVADGAHTLTAVATSNDSSQLPATASAVVIVNNSGTLPVLSATPGWHKIAGTAICGGPENSTFAAATNFPNNLNSSFTSYGNDFADQCYGMMTDSNTAIFDTARNRMIIWGGGHNINFGNDVYDVELNHVGTSNSVMNRLTNPADPLTCPASGPDNSTVTESNGGVCVFNSSGQLNAILVLPACSYTAGCYPTGTSPGARHDYNNLVYIPAPYGLNGHDAMWNYGGATNPNGAGDPNTWSLDLASVLFSCAINQSTALGGCNPAWTNLNPTNPPVGASYVNEAGWDPNNNLVWMIYASNAFVSYNPTTNTYTQHGTLSTGYHSMSVIDPYHKLFISIGGQYDGLHYFDISNPSATNLTWQTPTLTGCTAMLGGNPSNPNDEGQYMGLVWDPIARQVVIYPNYGNVIYLLDPGTWTCTSETYGSTQGTDYPQNTDISYGGPGINAGTEGTFGHFQYSPANDVFLLCNDWKSDCWYLRRNR